MLGPALLATAAGPYVMLRKFLMPANRSPIHGPQLSGRQKVAWSDAIEIRRFKRLKNALGTTLNDVLMACVAGAFQRYLSQTGGITVDNVRAVIPVNLRPPDAVPRMENQFAMVFLELPTDRKSALARLRHAKLRMDAIKKSIQPLVLYGTAVVLLAALPPSWSRFLIDSLAKKCSCVLTNVPGPMSAVQMGGSRVRTMMFWVPQRANIGLGISLISYDGWVRVGVIADESLMPEPRLLIDAFDEELGELEAVPSTQASWPPSSRAVTSRG